MRIQARITLPASMRGTIDAARVLWNPEIASNNPAHVTVVYHDEAPDLGVLRSRLANVCRRLSAFTLYLSTVERFERPDSGAFIRVVDAHSRVQQIRDVVLAPPFTPRARFGLHVTLLHPAQGSRLSEAWPSLCLLERIGAFAVDRIDIVTGAALETETLVSLPLQARPN